MLEKETSTTLVVLTTSFVALFTGYVLGIYTVRGYLVSPELHKEARANYDDPVDSDETDVDEDETVLDHAPNWANGEEADRRQGLRAAEQQKKKDEEDEKKKKKKAKAEGPTVEDTGEECKLVLVVRTDLGMTKGMFFVVASLCRTRRPHHAQPALPLPSGCGGNSPNEVY